MSGEHILITGGTGFIGSQLCRVALARGLQVHVLSRDIERAAKVLPAEVAIYQSLADLPLDLPISYLVNLAGEPLVAGRWNRARKQSFYDSRIKTTERLFEYFSQSSVQAPLLLINGSAVGYYGPHIDKVLDEAAVFHDSFSHQLCAAWETSAERFHQLNTRVCCLRTAVVLGANGGALARMLPAFKWGLGGPIGSGKQWMPWVHMDDLIGLMFHCIKRSDISGAINGASPNPLTNRQFSKTLARVLGRPALFSMPSTAARLLFGEMADELLLTGQRVYPRKALETGFEFLYPDLESALRQILAQ